MMIKAPNIDNRSQKDLIDLTKELMTHYCPEWTDKAQIKSGQMDEALIQLFSRMMAIIIERLNRAPDKNLLTFLDLMGIRLSPPHVARVPLSFAMAKGTTQYGFIPAGTQVAGETDDKRAVIFETAEDLTVILPKLVKAVSIDPRNDRFQEHEAVLAKGGADTAETLLTGTDLIPHRLYFGHDALFSLKESSTIVLDIMLKKEMGKVEDWGMNWYGHGKDLSNPKALSFSIKVDEENPKLLKITFNGLDGLAEQTLNGFEKSSGLRKSWKNYWIYAELDRPISQCPLLEIDSIQASLKVTSLAVVAPDLGFFNNLPIDLTKDFAPFGEKPKFNDTFYLASKEVFSKENAAVTITIKPSDSATPDTADIKLIWEYCDGKKWLKIGETTQAGSSTAQPPYNFMDTTKAFTISGQGQVTFACPAVGAYTLNGEENYWIRVRIIGGNYGQEATYQEQTQNGKHKVIVEKGVKYKLVSGVKTALSVDEKTEWIYIPATYRWPSIESLELKYELEQAPENLQKVLSYNDFLFEDQTLKCNTRGETFKPFTAVADQDPALYLAFDQDISTLPVNLFLPLEATLLTAGQNPQTSSPPIVAWEYRTGKVWSILAAKDETLNFTRQGMIQFPAPGALNAGLQFESQYFWIRARLAGGQYAVYPKIKTIYANAVWAHNRITRRNEILGSSNGKPGQSFQCAHYPVLSGQEVWVAETALTEEEMRIIRLEEGPLAVKEDRDNAENITTIRVRWHEVIHFHFSGPSSRHYILDRNKGAIVFGDGIKGMIPPAGKDNMIVDYQYGGGENGNVRSRILTKLRTSFPYVDSVTNPIEAQGGFDMEDLDHVRTRGPQSIKNRQRAVTYEDFEWLVREASPKIALVKCLPTTDISLKFKPGWITLIVVPQSDEAKPLPSQELLREIEEYLFARTSTYLTLQPTQINLLGPGYIKVGSDVTVVFTSLNQAKIIEGRISSALQNFFHPLRGGAEQKGWGFGRDVYISEVYELIEKIEGVDYVQDLRLHAAVQIYTLQLKNSMVSSYKLPAFSTVRSVDHKIRFTLAEEISANPGTKRFQVTGFKEGDLIELKHGTKNLQLNVLSVAGDVLECHLLATITGAATFPAGSRVTTADGRIRSYTLNELTTENASLFLKTAVFEKGDKGLIVYQDKMMDFEINGVGDRLETVFINDHYLVYSGTHFVNRNAKDEPVFPFLLNTHSKEVHDLKNESPNCKIAKTLRAHRLFLREIDKTTFEQKKMDYCRWCFGKEMSTK